MRNNYYCRRTTGHIVRTTSNALLNTRDKIDRAIAVMIIARIIVIAGTKVERRPYCTTFGCRSRLSTSSSWRPPTTARIRLTVTAGFAWRPGKTVPKVPASATRAVTRGAGRNHISVARCRLPPSPSWRRRAADTRRGGGGGAATGTFKEHYSHYVRRSGIEKVLCSDFFFGNALFSLIMMWKKISDFLRLKWSFTPV